jgi:hypothetical protein
MSEIIRDTDPPLLDDDPEDDDSELDSSLLEPTEGFDSEPSLDDEEGWEGRHQPPIDIDKVNR